MKLKRLWQPKHGCQQHSLHALPKQPGQALVELALSLTLLVMLLGAAVDLGLAYKAHQTLTNATAEASTYLSLRPLDPTAAAADATARERFRTEQGTTMRGLGSTLDLNGDAQVDNTSVTQSKVQIKITDSSQVNAGSNNTLIPNLLPASTNCETRDRRFYTSSTGTVRQCLVVVHASMVYKPFFITPFVGSEMTITAISVKPIVGAPF